MLEQLFDLSALLLDELLLLNELFHGRYLMRRHYLRLRLWLQATERAKSCLFRCGTKTTGEEMKTEEGHPPRFSHAIKVRKGMISP